MSRYSEIMAAAHHLASLGLAIHWLRGPKGGKLDGRGKAPMHAGWQQGRYLPPWEAAMGYRIGANLGIHTGRVSSCPFPVVVVDLDGPEALIWAAAHLPGTYLVVRSCKGEHWYYRRPDHVPCIPCRARVGGMALDVRADHGNIVAPPSVHPSGFVYCWRDGPPTAAQLARLPVYDPA